MFKPYKFISFEDLDYDPFGMLLSGRNWSAGSEYRYGFNGQEQEDEIYGNGNLNTAEFWEYDTRLGRRWNLDPFIKISESPYATFSNCPTILMDQKGDKVSYDNKETKRMVKWQKRHDKEFRHEFKEYKKKPGMYRYWNREGSGISISKPELWDNPEYKGMITEGGADNDFLVFDGSTGYSGKQRTRKISEKDVRTAEMPVWEENNTTLDNKPPQSTTLDVPIVPEVKDENLKVFRPGYCTYYKDTPEHRKEILISINIYIADYLKQHPEIQIIEFNIEQDITWEVGNLKIPNKKRSYEGPRDRDHDSGCILNDPRYQNH